MAKYLHLLGALAYRHPWRFIAGWVVILGLLGVLAATFMQPTSSDISIPGTAAQRAIDRADELFVGSGGGTGRIVFHAKNNSTITDFKEEIERLVSDVNNVDGVTTAVSPFANEQFIAASGDIAYSQVQLEQGVGSVDESTIELVEKYVSQTRSKSLQIEVAGDLLSRVPGEIIGPGEVVGVLVALMVLVITFGSLVAAGMPLISALIAVGVSMAGLFSLSQVITINTTTPVLAVMLGLAVGIDYSLFIINKYRSYLKQGSAYPQAAAMALGTAGNAVVFAALTVVIALAALSVVNIPFMTIMGLVGAASIAVSALVAITLTPALLSVIGPRVFNSSQRTLVAKAQSKKSKQKAISHNTFWYKWGELLTRRPMIALAAALAIIAVIAVPVRDLQLGLPTDQFAATDSTQRKAYDLLAKGFGPGFNAPLTVIVEGLPKVSEADEAAIRDPAMEQLNDAIAKETARQRAMMQQQAASATTPEQMAMLQQQAATMQAEGEKQRQAALANIEASVDQYAKLVQLGRVADEINSLPNVETTLPAVATDDGTAGIIQVIPATAPADTKTATLIETLRESNTAAEVTSSDDTSLAVTGSTALQNDINEKLASALPVYVAVVVGLSLVLLVIAFRSVLVPIKATLGFLLSVLAMFGALVAVFQWGWFGVADAPGPIVSFVPIIATGILFGLAMDYEFCLVSGMHETYQHTKQPKRAVAEGFAMGAKVVTAAGIIMVSVFAGFIANHDSTVQSLGFGLAIGILIYAFLVRMTIVPAVMTLLGNAAWWLPKWLDKLLPHVSIEGEVIKK